MGSLQNQFIAHLLKMVFGASNCVEALEEIGI
jgi:hypothetical protein